MAGKKDGSDTKKSGSTSQQKGGLASIQFINVNLTESHKAGYKKWIEGNPDIFSLMDDFTMGGYKLTGSYDEKGRCFLATATNRAGQPAFHNHCFNLRARTMAEALARVLWLHFIFAEGDWSSFAEPSDTDDIW